MSNTQSIIVYRNPMEQAAWESGLIPAIVLGVCVYLIVFLITYLAWGKLEYFLRKRGYTKGYWRYSKWARNLSNVLLIIPIFPAIWVASLYMG